MSNSTVPQVPTFGPASDDRTGQIHISAAICYVIAFSAVALRLITRTALTSAGLWLDDWLIVVALICQTGFMASIFTMIDYGLGRHVNLANIPQIVEFFKVYIPVAVFYVMTYGFMKLSILAFYFRIFNSNRKIRWPIFITTAITVGWTVACVLVNIFQCRPVAYWWDRTIPNGVCIDNTAFLLGNTLPNIITDWVILAMPIPIIWSLNQSAQQKLALTGCFLLGGFVSIVTIVRFVMQLRTDYTSPDLSWTVVNFVIWSNVETNIAILGACLPSLRPIWSFLRAQSYTYRSRLTGATPLRGADSTGAGSRRTNASKQHEMLASDTESHTDSYPLPATNAAQASRANGGGSPPPKDNNIHVSTEFMVRSDR